MSNTGAAQPNPTGLNPGQGSPDLLGGPSAPVLSVPGSQSSTTSSINFGNAGNYPDPSFGQTPDYQNGQYISTEGSNQYAQGMASMANAFMNEQATNPQNTQFGGAMTADQGGINQNQAAQLSNIYALHNYANGSVANPADATMAAGQNQANLQQQAMARSAGVGGAGALAARNAQMNIASGNINNANQTAQANAAFQAQAAQAANSAVNQYAQQQQQAQQNAQQYGINYGQMQENQNVQNSQNQLAAQQQGMNAIQGQLTSDSNIYDAESQANTNQQAANAAARAGEMSGAIGGIATAGAVVGSVVSDERLKHDVTRESMADKFLDYLHPYSYRYDNPADEPGGDPTGGKYLGVMAQDIEMAPEVGRQLVKDTPRGKALNVPATVSALAAGVGRLAERLKALEAGRKAASGGQ